MKDTLYTIISKSVDSNGISSDTIFTTVITISIFVLGYVVNKIFENRKENYRLAEIKEYFLFKFKSFSPLIEKQISEYRCLSQNISKQNSTDFNLAEAIDSSVVSFSNLPFDDFYKIFISNGHPKSKLKYEKYNDLVTSLNFIDRQIEYSKQNFNVFFNDYRRYENDWESSLDYVFRFYDQILSITKRYNLNATEDQFLMELGSQISKWKKESDITDILKSEEELIVPLKDICKKFIEDERALVLLPSLIKASRSVMNLKNIKKIFSEYFESEAKRLEEKKTKLLKAIDYYS